MNRLRLERSGFRSGEALKLSPGERRSPWLRSALLRRAVS